MRIYLDACCINRLTDDQSQARIREEAVAVEHILRLVRANVIQWLSSVVLKGEVVKNPDWERRGEAEVLLSLATETLAIDSSIVERARATVRSMLFI
jgi:hypothetical protein